MAIVFHKESRCFHLYNNEVSYIIRIMENEQLEQLYYGKRIHDREDFTYFHEECMRSQMSINVPEPGILPCSIQNRNSRLMEPVITEARH